MEKAKQKHYAKNTWIKRERSHLSIKKLRGRPLMLEIVDEKVCNFLQIVRRKGGVVNSVVAIATAKDLVAKNDLEHLKVLDQKYQNLPKMKLLLFYTIKLSILLRSIKYYHQC